MLKAIYKTISVSMLTLTLSLPHINAYAGSIPADFDPEMLTSISMMSMGEITTRLHTYKPKMTADMVLAAAAGRSYVVAERMTTAIHSSDEEEQKKEVAQVSEGKQTEAILAQIKSSTNGRSILVRKKDLQLDAAAAFKRASEIALEMKEKEVPSNVQVSTVTPAEASKVTFSSQALALILSPAVADEEDDKILTSGNYLKCIARLKKIAEWKLMSIAVKTCGLEDAQALSDLNDKAKKTMAEFVRKRDEVKKSPELKSQVDALRTRLDGEVALLQAMKEKLTAKGGECAITVESVKVACQAFGQEMKGHEVYGKFAGIFSAIPTPKINQNYVEKFLDFTMPAAFAASNDAEAASKAAALLSKIYSMGKENIGIMMDLAPALAEEFDLLMFAPFNRAKLWQELERRSVVASEATQREINDIDGNINLLEEAVKQLDKNLTPPTTSFERFFNIFIAKASAETNKFPTKKTMPKILDSEVKMPCATGPNNGNCQSFTSTLRSSAGYRELSPALQLSARESTDLADELSGANWLGDKAAANAHRIASKYEASPKTSKQNKQDTDLFKKFNSITASILRKHHSTPATFYANYSGTSLKKSDANSNPQKSPVIKKAPANLAIEKTQKSAFAGVPTAEVQKDEKIPTYKFNDNDINHNKEESIFTTISNRYLKSAFPKTVEDKKSDE